jgi:hypothetical protein
MITITSRHELRHQTHKYVLLEPGSMYVRAGDEYIRKLYFDLQEVAQILEMRYYDTYMLCQKIGVQARANKGKKIRLTLTQLRKLSAIKNGTHGEIQRPRINNKINP